MAHIQIVGEDRLAELEAMFALLGGNPFAIPPWGCFMEKGSRARAMGARESSPAMELLVEKIVELRERVACAKRQLGSRRHGDLERKARDAFFRREKFLPPLFEYGLGAGNWSGHLLSTGQSLYYVETLPEYRQRVFEIARWVE